MTSRVTSRTARTLLTGVATSAYYATPDFIASRRRRGLAKAALAAVITTAALPDAFAAKSEETTAETSLAADVASLPTSRKLALVGGAAAFLAGSIALTVGAERWIFRRGEARAAAGVRLPHTRTAVMYGALSTVLSLIPTPDERR
ncbi:peptidase S9 [Aeromicrobium phragmitis]|uniref:Peptidase S9 n=1 Tax=Aeromicrobium phragmitis TaxID=2478914 RepID=A0A3L8PJY7_9ACTN|nr:peptidase S9 [Aeromicrobium phragmitis]RLV55675.1 peptidase S9 [Aeromicrobium phragmitis]